MDFINELENGFKQAGSEIKQAGCVIAAKTGELVDTAKLKMKLSEAERALGRLFMSYGKALYEDPAADVAELVIRIDAQIATVKQLKADLKAMKGE